jgi:hypothetical protein
VVFRTRREQVDKSFCFGGPPFDSDLCCSVVIPPFLCIVSWGDSLGYWGNIVRPCNSPKGGVACAVHSGPII